MRNWSKIRVGARACSAGVRAPAIGMQRPAVEHHLVGVERYRDGGSEAETCCAAAGGEVRTESEEAQHRQRIITDGKRKLSYAIWRLGSAGAPAFQTVTLKEKKDWKILGKPTRRLDSPEKINGKAQFGIDVQFEGFAGPDRARAVFGGT